MDVSLHEALREAADPTVLMRRVAEQALRLLPQADGASLEIRVDDDTLEYVVAVGTLQPFRGLRLNVHTSLSGLAARSGRIVRSDDAREDPRADPEAIRRTGVVSVLALPLARGDDRVAVLKVTSQRPRVFTAADDHVLASLSHFVRTVLNMSSELARMTSLLLASDNSDEQRLHTARFVAEVMRPGLVADIAGHQRVQELLDSTTLTMVVQPISDMRTGDIRMVEALARFSASPLRGPDHWFAEAHRVGLGLQLELAAVQRGLELLPSLPAGVDLSINVAPVVLRSPAILDLITEQHRDRLVLEITEHQAMDPLSLTGPIEALRAAGVRIAIDDTGTGYASLSALLRIKPDIIKLDRDIVHGLDHDPVRKAMAKALVYFAREDDVTAVIAEGVETEAEATTLLDLGVDLAQGFFLARPVNIAQFPQQRTWHLADLS